MGEEIIEKCHYPDCKKDVKMTHQIKLTNDEPEYTDNGSLIEAVVGKPFCWYHYYVVAGNHFRTTWDNKKESNDTTLHGPFEQVSLMEQVTAARKVTEKIREEEQKNKGK